MDSNLLDSLIPGEIINDSLAETLQSLASQPDIRSILEIGSSSGTGSTDALVAGLKQKSEPSALYCLEVSPARCAKLRAKFNTVDFVHCVEASSIAPEEFPTSESVSAFYDSIPSSLNAYPKPFVLEWLRSDLESAKAHGATGNGINLVKSQSGLASFDLVFIDGSEFTGLGDLTHVLGAQYLVLNSTKSFKNWNNYFLLRANPAYELISEDRSLRSGFCVFKRVDKQKQLPIHFFTIVLNGMPFIRYHLEMMLSLPFDWHWHIVEGVAELKHDTAWSVGNGGSVSEEFHFLGRSRDGTTEYLDELVAKHPEKVSVYRKPPGTHWDGKLEMVNAPLGKIRSECLLWEIDVDEFWTAEKLIIARNLFLKDPSRTSAFYWCHFFVGQHLTVSTRNCYSQNPGMEWLRTWRFDPNCRWVAHEPPRLAALQADGTWADQGSIRPYLHSETEAAGLVFHHYAYATESQLRFKEVYYGYRNAVAGWQRLQAHSQFPCLLREFFPWVHDATQINTIEHLGIEPIPGTDWLFNPPTSPQADPTDIIVDSVFFQYYNTGIARVWRSLLTEWAQSDFGKRLLVLDRAGKAPRIPGLRYLEFPAHNYSDLARDRQLVQQVCDRTNAQLFISSYYSAPLTTASVLLVHDMIPEILNADLQHPMWAEKINAIQQASAYVCVSQNTADDLLKFHPAIPGAKISVSHNGATFHQPSPERIAAFRAKHRIEKPYFLVSGGRSSYKNIIAFFNAFAKFEDGRSSYAIVCTGPGESLQAEFVPLVGSASLHLLDLPDDELECAYAGALALAYPSLYEGFGMPIIEAMACGCPVITCPNGPLPEVAGEAAIYVPSHDVNQMFQALKEVQQADIRATLVRKGLARARLFSWQKMANEMKSVMLGLLSK